MELINYILGGLGNYLGFSSIFISLILLITFMLLAMRFGLQGYALFIVFLLSTSYTLIDFPGVNFTPLFIYALLVVAILIAGFWWFILKR